MQFARPGKAAKQAGSAWGLEESGVQFPKGLGPFGKRRNIAWGGGCSPNSSRVPVGWGWAGAGEAQGCLTEAGVSWGAGTAGTPHFLERSRRVRTPRLTLLSSISAGGQAWPGAPSPCPPPGPRPSPARPGPRPGGRKEGGMVLPAASSRLTVAFSPEATVNAGTRG